MELLSSKGFFVCKLPKLALQLPPSTMAVLGKNGITGDLAGNYHLMDEESTGRMVIQPGITSSGTKNTA
jgi:hypothetical protein